MLILHRNVNQDIKVGELLIATIFSLSSEFHRSRRVKLITAAPSSQRSCPETLHPTSTDTSMSPI